MFAQLVAPVGSSLGGALCSYSPTGMATVVDPPVTSTVEAPPRIKKEKKSKKEKKRERSPTVSAPAEEVEKKKKKKKRVRSPSPTATATATPPSSDE